MRYDNVSISSVNTCENHVNRKPKSFTDSVIRGDKDSTPTIKTNVA